MVPYCSDETVSFSGFWNIDETETELIAMAPVSWAKPKEVKLRTKDIEDFLRKKLWRKNNLKGERHGS